MFYIQPTERYIYDFDNSTMEEEFYEQDDVCAEASGTITANRLGDMCVQNGMLNHAFAGSEDCLFLNVYTPKVIDLFLFVVL